MANAQHLEWLLEGVETWNARRRSVEFTPDLSRADLRGVQLGHVNLRKADLRSADLRKAHLGEAICDAADLTGAMLTGADLRRASFAGAVLVEADLTKANLKEARLEEANLRRADLLGANLKQASLFGADVDRADLTDADVRTEYTCMEPSEGYFPDATNLKDVKNLTDAQLASMNGDRGVILPEGVDFPGWWPETVSPEVPDAFEGDPPHPGDPRPSEEAATPFLFLSYFSGDRPRIAALHEFLTAGNIKLWWDQDIPAGDAWRATIAGRLERSAAILTVWTAESTESNAVIEEAATAQAARKLLHVRLDDAPLPYGFAETQYVDLRDWDGTATHPEMAKLLQAIRDKLAPPSHTELAARLARASPVAFRPLNGQFTAVDTPPDSRPTIENPADFEDRLTGLFDRAATIADRLETHRDKFQTPPDLPIRFREMADLQDSDRITWYALDDARQSLIDCMELNDGRQGLNPGLVADIDWLSARVDQIEPLLRPRQIPSGEPDAKPVVPEPDLAGIPLEDLNAIELEMDKALASPEAVKVLDPVGLDALARELRHLKAGNSTQSQPTPSYSLMRRGVAGLGMVIAAYVTAVSQGVFVNYLTAPDAAVTLMNRIQPILDAIHKLFY